MRYAWEWRAYTRRIRWPQETFDLHRCLQQTVLAVGFPLYQRERPERAYEAQPLPVAHRLTDRTTCFSSFFKEAGAATGAGFTWCSRST
ncbi:hypothetical protein SAMN00120144_3983 [Hymenobacter roseosalivarius DSM 11622]|uniref:Uncharacterized protein n=1 Tax=Hymenobacter roseosalivarius DSM 11622 TaxID=645990 RepID=A0A1W1UFZ6_9BACT|nr:hypothetical protein SAMN00120144_3983 [Hymenobacter roseosalivarius DSM 11622]